MTFSHAKVESSVVLYSELSSIVRLNLYTYVTMNNETHLTSKKSISKFSPFLIENSMGISMRPFSGHENDSIKSYGHFS